MVVNHEMLSKHQVLMINVKSKMYYVTTYSVQHVKVYSQSSFRLQSLIKIFTFVEQVPCSAMQRKAGVIHMGKNN